VAPVFFSTMLATNLKLISFPAPGPFGNTTATGRRGSQANARIGTNRNMASNFFIELSFVLNTYRKFCKSKNFLTFYKNIYQI
jgi:hypothetical protein